MPVWLTRSVRPSPQGVWALHCHIDWHVRAGLVAMLIEAPELLKGEGDGDGSADADGDSLQPPASHISACAVANSLAGASAIDNN
jgi:iron transport multicopper oxidase